MGQVITGLRRRNLFVGGAHLRSTSGRLRCFAAAERLEARRLLATLSGVAYEDLSLNGLRDADDPGLAGRTIFIDVDSDYVIDSHTKLFASADVPKAIPAVGLVNSTVNVSGISGIVKSLTVTLNISHTNDEDLDVFLIGPTGRRVELFTDVGGTGNHFTSTTLDDDIGLPIAAGTAPFSSTFMPEGLLADYANSNPLGTWTLEITDDAAPTGGTLNSWSISLTYGDPSAVTDGAGAYSIGQLAGGSYVIGSLLMEGYTPVSPAEGRAAVNVNADVVLDFGSAGDGVISGKRFEDTNGNGVLDAGESGQEGWSVYLDYNGNGRPDGDVASANAADVPLAIPDDGTANSFMTVSGLNGYVTTLSVTISISHTNDEDLDVYLVSPRGHRVELFTDVGGSGNHFTGTALTDSGATSIAIGVAPFANVYRPEEPLAEFIGDDPNGVWRLEVTDDNPGSAGTLTAWGMGIAHGDMSRLTSASGDYSFSGLAPGVYNVQSTNQATWRQTAPRNDDGLIGFYPFDFGGANLITSKEALPALTTSNVAFSAGDAIFDAAADVLTLAKPLGSNPFTIYIDADYDAAANGYIVSQVASAIGSGKDFTVQKVADHVTTSFNNSAGDLLQSSGGPIVGRHYYALTSSGMEVGGFFDNQLVTQTFATGYPDTDGASVRFGDTLFSGSDGLTGRIHEVRIYDRALSEEELINLRYSQFGYTLVLESGESADQGNFGAAQLGTVTGKAYHDLNENGVRDAGDANLSGRTVLVDQNANYVVDNVVDDASAHIVWPLLSVALVDDGLREASLVVSGLKGFILDLNVTLNITHANDADLDVYLISPNGTRIPLFTDVGGTGNHFTNTVLDDEAANPITGGTAPFTGTFQPKGQLSDFDYEDPNGEWTLEITDDTATNTGSLLDWWLDIAYSSVEWKEPNLPLADNDVSQTTVAVGGLGGFIKDVNVTLSISHNSDADLDVFLISPSATRVQLFTDVGGTGNHFLNTTLNDEAATAITAGAAPFAGSFRPEGLLSDFDHEDPNGVWTLQIVDDTAGSAGTLTAWRLQIDHGDKSAVTNAGGDYSIANVPVGTHQLVELNPAGWLQDGTTGGARTVTVPSGAAAVEEFGSIQTASMSGQVFEDTNANGIKDAGETGTTYRTLFLDYNGNRDTDLITSTRNSSDVPLAIPDLETATSLREVTGLADLISHVKVKLTILHTRDEDLDIFLVSPRGTRVELCSDVGGTGDNFINTVFDDSAGPPIDSAINSHPPFTGEYIPEGSLDDLLAQDPNGIWRLEITDDSIGEVGTLDSWSLEFVHGDVARFLNTNSNFSYADVPPGNYSLVLSEKLGWYQTYPDGPHVVSLSQGASVPGVNFGTASSVITGTSGIDNYIIRLDSLGTHVEVFRNVAVGPNPTFVYPVSSLTTLRIDGGDGNDSVTVDLINGNPIPPGYSVYDGLTFDGQNSVVGGDSLTVIGTPTSDGTYEFSSPYGKVRVDGRTVKIANLEGVLVSGFDTFSMITPISSTQITIETPSAGKNLIRGGPGTQFEPLTFNQVRTFTLDMAANNVQGDTITVRPQGIGAAGLDLFHLLTTGGTDNLILQGGASRVDISRMGSGGTLNISTASNTVLTLPQSQTWNNLTASDSSRIILPAGGDKVLRANTLTMSGSAQLDLADNDMILDSTADTRDAELAGVAARIASGRNAGAWDGPGIISSSAGAEPGSLTGLAPIINDDGAGGPLHADFDGQSVDNNDILIKYVWNGDTDLSGGIDADDYFNIDIGFSNQFADDAIITYRTGDFDFSGTIDADDYFLIDQAFASQSGALANHAQARQLQSRARLPYHGRHRFFEIPTTVSGRHG